MLDRVTISAFLQLLLWECARGQTLPCHRGGVPRRAPCAARFARAAHGAGTAGRGDVVSLPSFMGEPFMSVDNTGVSMWARAVALLEEAERRHRRFFELLSSTSSRAPVWEPPVDMFLLDRELRVVL